MNSKTNGELVNYEVTNISPNTSFLEMLDVVNEQLLGRGEEPIAFDSDCREGICGTCSLTINGEAHGPDHPSAVCQLYMRRFKDGDTIYIEPFRAKAFPIIKDLVVDRSALDRVVQAGGFISARTRFRAGSKLHSRAKEECRSGHGSSSLHWLRCLCGSVSKCFRDVIYRRKSFAPRIPASRRAGTPSPRPEHGSCNGRRRFRELHKHLRMRRGLPGRHQRERHGKDVSRIRGRGFTRRRVRRFRAPSPGFAKQKHLRVKGNAKGLSRKANTIMIFVVQRAGDQQR
jgi:hypothetical protein